MSRFFSSLFQALDSLQRAQELADGMGNKVTGRLYTGNRIKHRSRASATGPIIDKSMDRKLISNQIIIFSEKKNKVKNTHCAKSNYTSFKVLFI